MDATANLALPYILPSQAQKHVPHNEGLRRLDALVQLSCIDRTLTEPPGSPADGDRHIVAAAATGAWAGKDGRIAAWQDGAWAFFVAAAGWLAWIQAESALLVHDGTGWTETTPQSFDALGVNSVADETNRLAVSSPAVLLNHDGSNQQTKINKAAAGDTASLVFQTGFSGRAEFGLAGADDFHVKVSADGASWNEAIVIDRATGEVSLPQTSLGASAAGDDGTIQMSYSDTLAPTGLFWEDTNKRLGVQTNEPGGSLHVHKEIGDRSSPALMFGGYGRIGPSDSDGMGLYLSYNAVGNRQFVIADTTAGEGIRYNRYRADAVSNFGNVRQDMLLGTETNGVHVGIAAIAATQFSVSNLHGTASKVVCEVGGAAGQTGDLLRLTKQTDVSSGDALTVDADGNAALGGNLQVDGSQIDFTNLPASDPAVAGRLWNDGGTVKISAG